MGEKKKGLEEPSLDVDSVERSSGMSELVAIKGDVASQIGKLYRRGIDAWRAAGELLMAQKAVLPHGQWLPWLEENADRLGFSTPRTAQRLIELVKCDVNDAFDLWGNKVRGTQGTGENEWYTPPEHLELARTVLGKIELDPASAPIAQKAVKAETFFCKEDNGLTQDWHGTVWLNPPYAQPLIAEFVDKFLLEWKSQRITAAIVLTHNYTDTAWFQSIAEICDAICFTRRRVQFTSPSGDVASPTQGQAFSYFGAERDKFVRTFAPFGFVMVRP